MKNETAIVYDVLCIKPLVPNYPLKLLWEGLYGYVEGVIVGEM